MSTTTARAPQPTRPVHILHLLQRASLAVLLGFVVLLVGLRVYPSPWLFPELPRVTHTAHGAAGDPLNIILVGSETQITASFAAAGWLVPDPITPETAAKIATASLAHRPYPTAPVSNLYVFGHPQDLAFERPTSDVQNRGHIRLWLTTTHLDGQPVWLGQASYDNGIELSGISGFPTHHILPAVDLMRDALGADLARTGLVTSEAYDPYTPPIFAAYNGGSDYYTSDGDILLVRFAGADASLPAPSGFSALVTGLTRGLFHGYALVLTTLPLTVGAMVVGLLIVLLALWPAWAWLWRLLHRRATALIA